jgi:ketosteroid isomerase-like protein
LRQVFAQLNRGEWPEVLERASEEVHDVFAGDHALAGEPYVQHGTHWFRIRWGSATEIRAYLDTQKVEQAMRTMADAGIDEAAAPPITG